MQILFILRMYVSRVSTIWYLRYFSIKILKYRIILRIGKLADIRSIFFFMFKKLFERVRIRTYLLVVFIIGRFARIFVPFHFFLLLLLPLLLSARL